MKIFITGATGFVGSAVAETLSRAGHRVYGLVRSDAKARSLAAREIHPVIGDMQRMSDLAKTLQEAEVLIHCAADMVNDQTALDKNVIDAFLTAAKNSSSAKTIIYSSGVWVHGNTGDTLVDETTPLNPVKLVAWRATHENIILNAANAKMRTLVIRPGCVYGGTGSLTGMWFDDAAKNGVIKIIGDGNNRWSMVHRADLAKAYLRLAESGLSGEVFNITDRSRFTIMENVEAVKKVMGNKAKIQTVPLEEARKTMGDFADCLALDQNIDSRKAVRLLGWAPKFGGFRDSIDTFYASWQAGQV